MKLLAPLTWFSRAVWLGIAANVSLALPLLVAPVWALNLFHLGVPNDLVWTRLSGLLVILLSLLYVPAAIDAQKYGRMCWLLVIARAGAAAFFFVQGGAFLPFAIFDSVFGIVQAGLLVNSK